MPNLVNIGIGVGWANTEFLSQFSVLPFVGFLFLYFLHRVLAIRLDRLRRAMAHGACFSPRKCLLGLADEKSLLVKLVVKTPKTKILGWNRPIKQILPNFRR